MSLLELSNIMIVVCGVPATYLVNLPEHNKWRKWGCIFGVAGIPFWFALGIITENHGLTVINIAYSIAWFIGVYNNWIRKDETNNCG